MKNLSKSETVELLTQEISAAVAEVDAARRRVRRLRFKAFRLSSEPQLRAIVGKCFKYRNSGGGGPRWWLYSKVIAYDHRKKHLVVCACQTTPQHFIEVRLCDDTWTHENPKDYHLFQTPITRKQFDTVLYKAIQALEQLQTLPKDTQ